MARSYDYDMTRCVMEFVTTLYEDELIVLLKIASSGVESIID